MSLRLCMEKILVDLLKEHKMIGGEGISLPDNITYIFNKSGFGEWTCKFQISLNNSLYRPYADKHKYSPDYPIKRFVDYFSVLSKSDKDFILCRIIGDKSSFELLNYLKNNDLMHLLDDKPEVDQTIPSVNTECVVEGDADV